ncbi:MAG TPA: helicase associated domain-containing protein [Chthoniobacteraceae bacterium]|nr:helicase associated domain-containing protein [Chthoniobacteraceae bacterium]
MIPSRDRELWQWIANQRRWRAMGCLRPSRRARMDAAGFPWEPVSHSWEESFARFRAYKARFGHPRVPAKWPEDQALGSWVSGQRSLFHARKLTEERRRRLEELGFDWART